MNLYYKESRLELTTAGEFTVRMVTYVTYASLVALTIVLLLSDIPNLKWLGLLLLLFLGDRSFHINEGEREVESLSKKSKNEKVNVSRAFTPKSHKILSNAYRKSLALDKNFYLFLLRSLSERGDIEETLERLGVEQKKFIKKIEKYQEEQENPHERDELLESISDLAVESFRVADHTNEKFIHPRELLVATAKADDPKVKKLFSLFDIKPEDLREAIIFGRYRNIFTKIKRIPSSIGGFAHRPGKIRKRIMNRAWTSRPTPFLDKFSTDLTALARKEKVGLLIGHKEEYDSLINILSRPDKPNAIVVGEPGTGKTTLIAHLAYKITKDEVPSVLFDKRLISLDIGSLIANAPSGDVAGRLKRIADEITRSGNIALFIPNIHNLFKPLGESDEGINAMDVLLPIIQNNDTPFIGESYPREFKKEIERRSDFLEQFEVVNVKEVSRDEAIRILIYQSLILENKFGVKISLKAIKKSVDLAYRYLHDKPLPENAIDLLKQALSRAEQAGLDMLNEETITNVAQHLSNVPIEQAQGKEVEKLLNLEEIIHERLINQDDAVKSVSRSLREYRSGLSREGGPIATFLFVGPTGVGKTELSKQLSKIQFGSKDAMIRFDMSEYQNKQSIYRLIGTPDGESTGSLTDAVRDKPYSLILLDEFEKAHPDILNIFLQVFDDGRLTDSLNRVVNFENTIIIATSNAHSTFIKKEIEKGKDTHDIAEELKQKLTSFFKPELLNRFSEVIVFRNLKPKEINAIAKILIKEVVKSIRESHGLDIDIEKSAIDKVAELGFSPVFGARPLRTTISEKIKSPLAEKILKDEVKRGDIVKISYQGDKFKFKIIDN